MKNRIIIVVMICLSLLFSSFCVSGISHSGKQKIKNIITLTERYQNCRSIVFIAFILMILLSNIEDMDYNGWT